MRILYGVVGEGMGHAIRSRVVLEFLLGEGHEIYVVVSGRAHGFLRDQFAREPRIKVREIHGLSLVYEDNTVDRSESLRTNLEAAPHGIVKNIEAYRQVAEDGFAPEVVISDFESWSYLYGRRHRLPVISIDNMQILNRCSHEADVTDGKTLDFRLAKLAVKMKLAGAYHYLVTSFFFPPVRKERTTLVPPILRPEVFAAKREPGAHVLVYQTGVVANEKLLPILHELPYEFRVYGMGKDEKQGNVTLRPFSQTGFLDDLRTARAVVAPGGYSLMGEAVHLRVPMLSLPLDGQYEQELNARYLAKLNYGAFAKELSKETIGAFLAETAAYQRALATYPAEDNSRLYACLRELLGAVARGEDPPAKLAAAGP